MQIESSLRSLSPSAVAEKLLEFYVPQNQFGGTEAPHVADLRRQFGALLRELEVDGEFLRLTQVQLLGVVGAQNGCELKRRRAWEVYSHLAQAGASHEQ